VGITKNVESKMMNKEGLLKILGPRIPLREKLGLIHRKLFSTIFYPRFSRTKSCVFMEQKEKK
jgi:hypothetical protein